MNWKKLGAIIGKAAPLLGTALGGPAGATIGALVSSALGVEDTPQAVSQAVKNDPDALIRLKQFELENEESIRNHAFKILDAELNDKQSARENHKHNPMPAIICVALTGLIALGTWLLFDVGIPDNNREIAYLLFGTMLAKWGDSIAYWVGTTRSSQEKTRLLK